MSCLSIVRDSWYECKARGPSLWLLSRTVPVVLFVVWLAVAARDSSNKVREARTILRHWAKTERHEVRLPTVLK